LTDERGRLSGVGRDGEIECKDLAVLWDAGWLVRRSVTPHYTKRSTLRRYYSFLEVPKPSLKEFPHEKLFRRRVQKNHLIISVAVWDTLELGGVTVGNFRVNLDK